MWVLWMVSALAGGDCEAMCAKVSACLGETTGAGLAECHASCGASGLPKASLDAIIAAPTCEAAFMALAMASTQAPAAATTPVAPTPAMPPAQPAQPAAASGQCRKPTGDPRVVQVLTSSAWCHYGYAGSTETRGRTVFRPDGVITTSERNETVRTGQNTNMFGEVTQTFGTVNNNAESVNACWDVEGESIVLSGDGKTYLPVPTSLVKNSAGWPILTMLKTEMGMCD